LSPLIAAKAIRALNAASYRFRMRLLPMLAHS
jgi:hypothetical protein